LILKTDAISILTDKRGKNRILTIDDNKDTSISIKIALEQSGLFKVDAFDDPILALASFKPDQYDVVVLDVRMPSIDGFTLYKKIKTLDKEIKVLFLTSVYDLDNFYRMLYSNVENTIEKNKDFIIDKPVGAEQLLIEINKLLRV
jgi:two-component system, OmpR family, response regulator ChvI